MPGSRLLLGLEFSLTTVEKIKKDETHGLMSFTYQVPCQMDIDDIFVKHSWNC